MRGRSQEPVNRRGNGFLEASRLARNGRDWHHLIDLCALVGALVIDPDGTYDPRLVNDRLLLGLNEMVT